MEMIALLPGQELTTRSTPYHRRMVSEPTKLGRSVEPIRKRADAFDAACTAVCLCMA
jgi:hypothetical protein